MTPSTISRGPAPSGVDGPGPDHSEPPLRRDAARNRAKILAAARSAFGEDGVDVGVEVIAHRAGVGVGTLYRRFPTKELLIEAVIDERAVGQLQFEHSGCLTRLWNTTSADRRTQISDATRELLARAQAAGAVRPDLVYEDVIVLFWSLRGVIETTSTVSPDAWLRHLDLLLGALGSADRPLRFAPLTPEQVERAQQVSAAQAAPARRSIPVG
jgi:AcrR family transcriptional regulator